jgi:hypothetical protein
MSLTSYMLSPYLYTNPQCYIQENKVLVGSNTRLDTKDIYTAINTGRNKNENQYVVPATGQNDNHYEVETDIEQAQNAMKTNHYVDNCSVFPKETKCNK